MRRLNALVNADGVVPAVLAGSAVFSLAVLIGVAADAQIGTFADWVAALATLAAFVAAVVAANFAAKAFLLESKREDRWEEIQKRSQAVLVAAWPQLKPEFVLMPGAGQDEMTGELHVDLGIDSVAVLIRNASNVPVTRVLISLQLRRLATSGDTVQQVDCMPKEVDLVPPSGDPMTVQIRIDPPILLDDEDAAAQWRAAVDLTFADAGGRIWTRTRDGWLWQSGEVTESTNA